jgi:hypothetical protein
VAKFTQAYPTDFSIARLFEQIKRSVHNRWCRLKLIWADGAR